MGNKIASIVASIYSFLSGLVLFSIFIENKTFGDKYNIYAIIFAGIMIFISLISPFVQKKGKIIRFLMTILLIEWIVITGFSVAFFGLPIFGPLIAVIGILASLTPLICLIVYLTSFRKIQVQITSNNLVEEAIDEDYERVKKNLHQLENLFLEGVITREEYEEKRRKVLEID